MSKKLIAVAAERLEIGMYIDSISGSWLYNPFWRSSFMIADPVTLQRLRKLGQVQCWIDSSRSVEEGTTPAVAVEAAQATNDVARTLGSVDAALRRFAPLRQLAGESAATIFRELRLGRAIASEECHALVLAITDATSEDPDAALALLRLKQKDEYTHMHSVAVCALMIHLANQMGLGEKERQQAGMAGLLHDIGKAAIPLEILNKPGGLTDAEFAVVRRHPEDSAAMLEAAGVGNDVREGCLYHHEKYDGSGYPKRLTGTMIPILARMCAICDVYDAITSYRPYKEGWDPAGSIAKMMSWKGHFDPAILGQFVRSVGIYPAGSLVRLRSGRLAVVVQQNMSNLTKPIVQVMFDLARQLALNLELDLLREQDNVVGLEDRTAWPGIDVDALWAPYLAIGKLKDS